MKKWIFSIALLVVGLSVTYAQSSKSLYVKLGAGYSTFQDVKYSSTSFGGAGGSFHLGFEKINSKSIWSAGFSAFGGKEAPNTFSGRKALVLEPKFHGRYLKRINDKFAIGGHWDILGLFFRKIDGLDNNGNYYLASSDLFASGTYQKGKFIFKLDLGLLSYQKELFGFAFSAPQNALEDGDFNYQNESLSNPFGFKHYTFNPIGKRVNLRTNIIYNFGNRLSVGYQWSVRHFAEIKNYPVTIGNHQLLIRYNIRHKTNSETKAQK